jgi:hypothetical protein
MLYPKQWAESISISRGKKEKCSCDDALGPIGIYLLSEE